MHAKKTLKLTLYFCHYELAGLLWHDCDVVILSWVMFSDADKADSEMWFNRYVRCMVPKFLIFMMEASNMASHVNTVKSRDSLSL